jgi:hypothetical protein
MVDESAASPNEHLVDNHSPLDKSGRAVCLVLAVTFGFLLSWGCPASATLPWSGKDLNPRPNPNAPTQVQVGLKVLSVTQIDEPDENFRLHAIYDIGWTDRRLAFDPVHEGTSLLSFEEENAREVLRSIW